MKPTTIVLLTLLALPGSARTDANGVTRFYDAMGRTTGTARTNSNGVTGAQADASGAREHAWLAAAPFFLAPSYAHGRRRVRFLMTFMETRI
jgi:hypothetical protein